MGSVREQRKLDAMAKRFAEQITNTKKRRNLSQSNESQNEDSDDGQAEAKRSKPVSDV
jgi:hypothetical protein